MRLILHTAAYWLILTMRDAIAATHALATAEFTNHPFARLEARHPRHGDHLPRRPRLCRGLPRGGERMAECSRGRVIAHPASGSF
jgi:hypothetical protein